MTPIGTDFNNAVAAHRRDPARAAGHDRAARRHDRVLHDDPERAARRPDRAVRRLRAAAAAIVDYQWDFGDGGRSSGRTASHAYGSPGTYVVRLTLVDPYGRQASTAQSITVGAAQNPTAALRLLADAGAGGRDGELQRLRLASGGRRLAVELYVGLRRRHAHDNRRAGGAEGLRRRRGLPGHALRH